MTVRFVRSRMNIAVTPVYRSAESCTTMLTTVITIPRTAAIIAPRPETASVM